MRKPAAAIRWGREQIANPAKDYTALCLQFVRMCFGLGAVYPDADGAWDNAKRKHPTTTSTTIPRGVPVFWRVGQYGHVALSLGGGLCLSTDIKRRGRVDIVRIDTVTQQWGARLLGWTEDLNGVTVWQDKPKAPPAPPAPKRTNVTRARAQLNVARRAVALAESYLGDVPEERTVARNVARSLDELDAAIAGRLERLPKR